VEEEEEFEGSPLDCGEVGRRCLGRGTTLRSHLERISHRGFFYLRVFPLKKMLSLWPMARG
jgi:hypothetical protein